MQIDNFSRMINIFSENKINNSIYIYDTVPLESQTKSQYYLNANRMLHEMIKCLCQCRNVPQNAEAYFHVAMIYQI